MKITLLSLHLPKDANANNTPLILFPPLMGRSDCYAWLLKLVKNRPILFFDMAESDDGVIYPSIQALGTAMLSLIKDKYPSHPLMLLGWSFGGILAAEVSRQIGLDKTPIPHYLMVMDSPPLSILQSVNLSQFKEHLSKIVGLLASYGKLQDKIVINPLSSREEQVCEAFKQLKENFKKATLPPENLKQLGTMLMLSESNMLLSLRSAGNQEISSNLSNRVLVFSTKETRERYGCGVDLTWSKKYPENVIESVAIGDGIDHFKMIREESIWSEVVKIIQRWNDIDKIDETCLYVSTLRLIKEKIQSHQNNANYLEKMVKDIFYPSLFPAVENSKYIGISPGVEGNFTPLFKAT